MSLSKIVLKSLYQSLGLFYGKPLGEELVSLDRDSNRIGLKNWAKKAYR